MNELEKITTYEQLPLVEKRKGNSTIIAFNERIKGENPLVYKYDIAFCEHELTYANIVTTLVDAKYSLDDTTAIMLNLLQAATEPDKYAEYQQEAEVLQQWRTTAKRIAKEVMEYVERNKIL